MTDPKTITGKIEEKIAAEAGGACETPPLWGMTAPVEERPNEGGESGRPASELFHELGNLRHPGTLPPGTPLALLKKVLGVPSRPAIKRQGHFNEILLELLGGMIRRVDQLEAKIGTLDREAVRARSLQEELDRRFSSVAEDLSKMRARDEEVLAEALRRVPWEDFESAGEQLRAQMSDRLDAIDALTGQLGSSLSEKGSQSDIETLFRAIEHRASYEEFNSLKNLTEVMRSSLSRKGEQKDVEKLYHSMENAFAAINDRMGLEDGGKLWNRVQRLEAELAGAREEARRLEARLLGLGEAQAVLKERLEEGVYTTGTAPVAVQHTTAPPPTRSGAGDDLLAQAYLRFQREFRGSVADLRQRQTRYIHLLEERYGADCTTLRIIDLACGDGIFLDLISERGWNGAGIDLNAAMVREAQGKGLAVELGDALAWLEGCERESIDVLTGFQFIEHLEPGDLARLLKATRRVLRPGGILILETIFPRTVKALQWYFLDLSHARLVFPEMLALLAETAGLRIVGWEGIHPVADHERLVVEGEGAARANTERLNEFLYGPQDYYLVAEKGK